MEYVEREVVTEDHFDHPVAFFVLATACIAFGFGLNAYLTGDTGQYTVLGLVPIVTGSILSILATASMTPTEREYTASVAVVVWIVPAILVSYLSGPFTQSAQAVLNAIIMGAVISMGWSMHDWVVSWYFDEESPEDRVLNE